MTASQPVHRSSNFDFLRLFLASMVIVSHSYPLSKEREYLMSLTHNQESFGTFAVNCFFVLSGYFIFISLKRSKTIKNYLWKRVLRLYPALFILMLFTLFLISFVYTGRNISQETSFWSYLPNGISLYGLQYPVTGVFEGNPYPHVVNGSLWSLSYEFSLYMALVLLFFIRKNRITFLILMFIFLISYYLFLKDAGQIYRLTTFFFAGSMLTWVDLTRWNHWYTRVFLAVVTVASLYMGLYKEISPLTLPLLVIMVGSISTAFISTLTKKIGDISYGVYIYGFLIQQMLMNYFALNSMFLMLISLPITFFIAYLSWHLVEEKMLRYKNMI